MSFDKFDDDKLCQLFNSKLFRPNMVDVNKVRELDDDQDIINYLYEVASQDIDKRIEFLRDILVKAIPQEVQNENPDLVEKNIQFQIKRVILPVLDRNWREHIDDMAGLRQGIQLQAYAQTNPLELYQREGFERFERLNRNMNEQILVAAMHTSFGIQRRVETQPKDEDTLKGLSTNQDLGTVKKKAPVSNKDNKFAKVGPNEPCPCGSGMKYKFCHGIKR
jgi:preprotein translocase subunit SecA